MASVKILVVEDEVIVAKDIQDTLKKQGYDVPAIALSGEQAIEKTEQIQPDLVLMDIVLKGDVDGIEAAEQIRRRFDIPVLYLTAYTDEQTVKRAKITEPFGYITKPFDKRELRTNIEMALYKHKAEEALRQSEKKFRSIFDNANDIIASVTKTGKILEVNKKIEDILGYKPDELIGRNFMTLGLLAAKNAAKMFHFFKESVKIGGFLVSRDGRNVTEVWVNHKDGHTVLLEANSTTIKKDGKLVGYLSIIRDITERKKAEEAYRSLVDHSLQGLAIFQNGRVVFTNQALADITGHTVEEMLAMTPEQVQAFVHPDDRELIWSRHRDRLNGEELPERYESLEFARMDRYAGWSSTPAGLSTTESPLSRRPTWISPSTKGRRKKKID